MSDRLANLFGVPYCNRCDRPMWLPVQWLFVAWLGRRYHFFCWRRTFIEKRAG